MPDCWNSTNGVGWSKYNADRQGIPENHPKWVKCYTEAGACMNPLISYSDSLYFLSSSNASHPFFCIDVNTGELKWKFDQPPVESLLPTMSANNDYVIVSNRLLTTKGEEVVNFSELLREENFDTDTQLLLGEKYILRVINDEDDPNRYFLYDLSTNKYSIIQLPVIWGELLAGNDLVYGYIEKADTNYLVCCSIDGEVIWEVEAQQGIFSINGNILNYSPNSICLYSQKSGELLNRVQSMENQLSTEDIYSFRKSYSFDTANILSNGDLYLFSIIENKLLSKIEGFDIHDYCVSGDLIFTRQGKWDLVAYDRYSGDELWRFNERYSWQSLIASNNKLVVYCSTGDIVCFDCGEPYISPHRPS